MHKTIKNLQDSIVALEGQLQVVTDEYNNYITKLENANEEIQQLYDLALLGQGMLKGKKLTDFIQRSIKELA